MPEGHTLHRLAAELDVAFGGRPVRVSSPQGRFAADAAVLDGQLLRGRGVGGQAPVRGVRRRPVRARAPRADRQVRRDAGRGAGAGRPGAAPAGEPHVVRRPARCDRVQPRRPGEARRGRRRPRAGPAAAGRRSGTGVAPDPPQRPGARRPADGPEGARGSRQRLPRGGALPAPARPAASGPDAAARPVGRGLGRPRRAARRGRAHRQDRHGPPGAHAGGDGPATAPRRPRGRGLRLPAQRTAVPGLRHAVCAPRCSRDAICSGVRGVSRVSARGRAPMSSLGGDGSNSRPSTVPAAEKPEVRTLPERHKGSPVHVLQRRWTRIRRQMVYTDTSGAARPRCCRCSCSPSPVACTPTTCPTARC